jgi:hypothetical protein
MKWYQAFMISEEVYNIREHATVLRYTCIAYLLLFSIGPVCCRHKFTSLNESDNGMKILCCRTFVRNVCFSTSPQERVTLCLEAWRTYSLITYAVKRRFVDVNMICYYFWIHSSWQIQYCNTHSAFSLTEMCLIWVWQILKASRRPWSSLIATFCWRVMTKHSIRLFPL